MSAFDLILPKSKLVRHNICDLLVIKSYLRVLISSSQRLVEPMFTIQLLFKLFRFLDDS